MNIRRFGLNGIDFLLRRNSVSRYQQLMQSQYYSYEKLCHIQNTKLKQLINHAYSTVSYYQTLMDRFKIWPEDIKNQEDLHKLPVLTKNTIRENLSLFISSKASSLRPVVARTGGSTGTPFEYRISRSFESYMWGSIWRAWTAGGYRPGDKVAVLGGDRIAKNSLKHKFYHFLNNWKYISITDLDDNNLLNIFQSIQRTACKMIYAYPTPLYLLSCYMLENGLNVRINHIVTTSEMLFPEHRLVIEKAFQCKVFDSYGANDGGALAFECDYFDGHHLSMERSITEVVNDKGGKVPNGTTGNLILTDLENYAMPLIRYKVGDRGSIINEPCECGRGLNRLQKISGRIKDFVELNNGRRIDGSYFTKRFRKISGIVLFQIIQKQSKDIYAKVSLSDEKDSKTRPSLEQLEETIANDLGTDFHIQVDSSFKRTLNQKFRYIIKENGVSG
jgi:phenylacetate-coenzyme A ligase PaaK-like adenylate-forming protein